jgi:hypothetical protein
MTHIYVKNYFLQGFLVPKFSLPHILDEIMILHSSIATRLLSDFADAYGVTFTLTKERSYVLARMDAPEGYADGYREPKLEALAKDMMSGFAPRMGELYDLMSSVFGKTDTVFLSAVRNTKKNGLEAMGGIEILGSIVGGIGAQSVRRQMVASEDRIFALSKARFELTGIIKDASAVERIQDSTANGFGATWDALETEKLFLNSLVAKKAEVSRLRKWLNHFPKPSDDVKFRMEDSVCHISTSSGERRNFLAVKSDDVLAADHEAKGVNNAGIEVLVFDPVRGFAQDEQQTFKPR